jgi:hypothetical protein
MCGFEGRTAAFIGMARDKVPEYLRALARGLEIPVESLVEPLKDYSCQRCGAVYLDPTLSDFAVSRLFLAHAPIHNWGWGRFTKKLHSDPPESGKVEALENFIRAEFGLPDRYLEVGCPFGGFAVMWADLAMMRRAVTSSENQNHYSQRQYRRLLRMNRKLMQWSLDASASVSRIWLRLNRLRRGGSSSNRVSATEVRLAFLAQFSMNQWSFGCSAFGRTCTEMASIGIGMDVLSLGRIRELPDNSFALAGIINSLDHSDNPLELLTEVIRVSQRVVVAGHRLVDAHVQHRFAFSNDTLPRLASELGWLCRDISPVLGDGSVKWFAYLISRS